MNKLRPPALSVESHDLPPRAGMFIFGWTPEAPNQEQAWNLRSRRQRAFAYNASHLAYEEAAWGRNTPKADVVVRIRRVVVVAVRRPEVVVVVVPTAPRSTLESACPYGQR